MKREGLDLGRDDERLLFADRAGSRRPGRKEREAAVRTVEEPWLPDSLGSLYQRIAKDAGLEGLTLKGIRKSHTGILIALGWSPQNVARRLGHSKAQTTWNYYVKPTLVKPGR
jgi:integrase